MIISKGTLMAALMAVTTTAASGESTENSPVFDISSLIVYEVLPGESLSKTLNRWAKLSDMQLAVKANGHSGVFDYQFSVRATLGKDLKTSLERLLKKVNRDFADKNLKASACIYTQQPSTLLVKVNQHECP